jgi:phosphatidylglycerol:prolipoprotein diacylglycerol transferase
VREPDKLQFYEDYGYFFGFMSIGQFLSLLMMIVGVVAIILIYRKAKRPQEGEQS